ncbi:uncharacterized protein FA14DRAFT_162371 [Meira miltonrushii]|uniref:Nucleoporin-domain-containing protein n=1 Tax=Meira miltonrushii TaxID=1280837 RepID=A0A316V3L2_9BASI|nr:uncharacterized protein FA14DRAFT_162371 [Meira miltonrushii]PWN32120.1 hypothetical protein FA14DRAFT_162371 [Meira miltonrushii]
MFSSPSQGPARRRQGDGSVRLSRASTPSMAGRSNTSRVGGQATPSTAFGKGKTGSSFGGNAGQRKRDSMRYIGSALRDSSYAAPSSIGDESFDSTINGDSIRKREKTRAGGLTEGTILSRDDNHSVSVFSRMPNDVSTALNSASPYDLVSGSLDTATNHAFIVTKNNYFIWSYSMRSYETPTCFAHSIASAYASSQQTILPSCDFVPKGRDRQPGFLLITPGGDVFYSDNVSSSFAQVQDKRQQYSIALGMGESVNSLHRCKPTLFVASTTHSRLICIRLIASGGMLQPVVTLFAQPRGIFGRLFGAAANLASTSAGIVGLASWSSNETESTSDVYAITQQTLQKWSLVDGRGEKMIFDEDVRPLLIERDERIADGSQSAESLKLVDVAVTKDGRSIILYSFPLIEGGALHYGYATLQGRGSELVVQGITSLRYSRLADTRSSDFPRLLIPNGGPVVYVVFTEAVIFRLLESDGLEESIELRDVSSNRIIGTGEPAYHEPRDDAAPASISVFTQRSGTLLISVDVVAAKGLSDLIASGEDRNVVDTHRLKTKLERGVFHSDNAANPISFDLPLDMRGDLIAAAEQLSDDIVRSESPSLINTLDTKLQLANRLERLHSLAAFLSLNGMMGLMTQNSLRRLCADAQLIASAIDLWNYVDELMSTPIRLQNVGNPFGDAVKDICQDAEDDDVLRHFFRFELRELNAVLNRVHELAQQSASQGISRLSATVCETNRILLTTYQAASRYQHETASLYGLDLSSIAFEAWTCTGNNVKILRESLSGTVSLIQDRTRQLGNTIDQEIRELSLETLTAEEYEKHLQSTLKGQLYELASYTLDAYKERLSYLRLAGSSHPSLEREYATLQEEYNAERRNFLLPLRSIGRGDRAFNLAEQHKDFETLTELCCSLSKEQRVARIRFYLNKYGQAFAGALYTYYAQNDEMQTLLAQDDSFNGLLREFLDANPSLNRVTWLHDFALSDFSRATVRLANEANNEKQSVSSKRLILSLAKLSQASHLVEGQIASQSEQSAIEQFDDQIDLVNIHDRIKNNLRKKANEAEGEILSPDDLLAFAEDAVLALSSMRPAFGKLYLHLAKDLFDGRVLSVEDLIDLLTLHDANEDSNSDFILAIEAFIRARDLPPARAQSALTSLWRRIILFDDWKTVTQTKDTADAVLEARLRNTALYHALRACADTESTSAAVLEPVQTIVQPSLEAIQARLSNTYDVQIEDQVTVDELAQDSQAEIAELEELMSTVDLSVWFNEVKRLVVESLGDQEQGDDIDFAALSNVGSQEMIM